MTDRCPGFEGGDEDFYMHHDTHLFRDWELVRAGVARPFIVPRVGRDDQEVCACGAE